MEAEMETKNSTADLLDRMYKNVKMGSDSIINLMPKVRDEALRTEMTKAHQGYKVRLYG